MAGSRQPLRQPANGGAIGGERRSAEDQGVPPGGYCWREESALQARWRIDEVAEGYGLGSGGAAGIWKCLCERDHEFWRRRSLFFYGEESAVGGHHGFGYEGRAVLAYDAGYAGQD